MAQATTVTLTADTVETVELTATGRVERVRVMVLSGAGGGPITYTIDGATPTAGGDDMLYLPDGLAWRETSYSATNGATITVRLISAGTPTVAVEAL